VRPSQRRRQAPGEKAKGTSEVFGPNPGLQQTGAADGSSGCNVRSAAPAADGWSLGLHDPVVPAVAVLHTIFAEVRAARVCLTKNRVRGWKRTHFAWYERVYVPVNGPCTCYRKNTEREFDGLARLAEEKTRKRKLRGLRTPPNS
jgi:hypothetical protein